jgi:Subtilase family
VAVIDSGFDLNHPMFRDSTGGLRVEALLDQSNNDREYTKWQLETAWANGQTPGTDPQGHGTHVASIAAGSPYLNWASGVAPDARLLLVKTDFQDLAAGASWAFKKAGSTPCVVNISLGHHFGPHDGTDQEERALEALAQPGRIIVVAAGNERSDNIHIGLRFSPGQSEETVFDVLRPPDNSDPAAILTIWYNKVDKFDLTLTTPSGRRLAFPALDRARSELDEAIRIDLSRQRYLFNDLIQAQAGMEAHRHVSSSLQWPARRLVPQKRRCRIPRGHYGGDRADGGHACHGKGRPDGCELRLQEQLDVRFGASDRLPRGDRAEQPLFKSWPDPR